MNIINTLIGLAHPEHQLKQEFEQEHRTMFGNAPIPDKPPGVSYQDMKDSLNHDQLPHLSQKTRDKILCANLEAWISQPPVNDQEPPRLYDPKTAESLHGYYCNQEKGQEYKPLSDTKSAATEVIVPKPAASKPGISEQLFSEADVLFDVLS